MSTLVKIDNDITYVGALKVVQNLNCLPENVRTTILQGLPPASSTSKDEKNTNTFYLALEKFITGAVKINNQMIGHNPFNNNDIIIIQKFLKNISNNNNNKLISFGGTLQQFESNIKTTTNNINYFAVFTEGTSPYKKLMMFEMNMERLIIGLNKIRKGFEEDINNLFGNNIDSSTIDNDIQNAEIDCISKFKKYLSKLNDYGTVRISEMILIDVKKNPSDISDETINKTTQKTIFHLINSYDENITLADKNINKEKYDKYTKSLQKYNGEDIESRRKIEEQRIKEFLDMEKRLDALREPSTKVNALTEPSTKVPEQQKEMSYQQEVEAFKLDLEEIKSFIITTIKETAPIPSIPVGTKDSEEKKIKRNAKEKYLQNYLKDYLQQYISDDNKTPWTIANGLNLLAYTNGFDSFHNSINEKDLKNAEKALKNAENDLENAKNDLGETPSFPSTTSAELGRSPTPSVSFSSGSRKTPFDNPFDEFEESDNKTPSIPLGTAVDQYQNKFTIAKKNVATYKNNFDQLHKKLRSFSAYISTYISFLDFVDSKVKEYNESKNQEASKKMRNKEQDKEIDDSQQLLLGYVNSARHRAEKARKRAEEVAATAPIDAAATAADAAAPAPIDAAAPAPIAAAPAPIDASAAPIDAAAAPIYAAAAAAAAATAPIATAAPTAAAAAAAAAEEEWTKKWEEENMSKRHKTDSLTIEFNDNCGITENRIGNAVLILYGKEYKYDMNSDDQVVSYTSNDNNDNDKFKPQFDNTKDYFIKEQNSLAEKKKKLELLKVPTAPANPKNVKKNPIGNSSGGDGEEEIQKLVSKQIHSLILSTIQPPKELCSLHTLLYTILINEIRDIKLTKITSEYEKIKTTSTLNTTTVADALKANADEIKAAKNYNAQNDTASAIWLIHTIMAVLVVILLLACVCSIIPSFLTGALGWAGTATAAAVGGKTAFTMAGVAVCTAIGFYIMNIDKMARGVNTMIGKERIRWWYLIFNKDPKDIMIDNIDNRGKTLQKIKSELLGLTLNVTNLLIRDNANSLSNQKQLDVQNLITDMLSSENIEKSIKAYETNYLNQSANEKHMLKAGRLKSNNSTKKNQMGGSALSQFKILLQIICERPFPGSELFVEKIVRVFLFYIKIIDYTIEQVNDKSLNINELILNIKYDLNGDDMNGGLISFVSKPSDDTYMKISGNNSNGNLIKNNGGKRQNTKKMTKYELEISGLTHRVSHKKGYKTRRSGMSLNKRKGYKTRRSRMSLNKRKGYKTRRM